MRTESTAAAVAHGAVRSEELTELVERLHRTQDQLSVGDVAETLGVAPEMVESTLRAMRAERVPPVVQPVRTTTPRPRSRRLALIAFAFLFVGGGVFNLGRLTGSRATRLGQTSVSSRTSTDGLSERLREALPQGMSVKIGVVTYTGSPGSVHARESELVDLIGQLIGRETQASVGKEAWSDSTATLLEQEIRQGKVPVTNGLGSKEIIVSFKGNEFNFAFPFLTGSLRPTPNLRDAIESAELRASRGAANRLAEWAETAPGQRPR